MDPEMDVDVVGKFLSTLPEDDDHPYRTGPWRPQTNEWRADDLTAVEGEIPADLDGLYLRNTENPLHPALKFYHPFDGDGMLHIVGFRDGKAFYRNRFIRTEGFDAEQQAGESLWPGLAEPIPLAKTDHGWGARTKLKDSSSTDVVVHRGTALTSFYQCGDLYRVDPYTGKTRGKETWNGSFPFDWGVSAHPKVDERTGEMLFFNYSKQAPYLHYGVVDANNDLVHYVDIPLPGPRLPHDMAFTRNYAILNDFPLFWQPELLERNLHIPHFYSDMPSRFAVIPRRGQAGSPGRSGQTSSGSRPTRLSSCISPTPTRTATRSCSTASIRATPIRSTTAPETSGNAPSGSWHWTACRPACTAGDSTSRPVRPPSSR
jgi:carotenoid cleavage dioxygenase